MSNITDISPLRRKVPDHTIGALDRYIQNGLEPGSFLIAVLSNDLFGAFAKADHINQYAMFDIVNYIYNECPASCHGSPEQVKNWLASHHAQ